MKGIELGEIRDAIVNAFDPDDFDIFLREHLDFDRVKKIADGAFEKVVFDVLRRADNEGWDAILIAEVAEVRPLKRDVQDVYRKYAAALIDVGRQKSVEASQLKAIERFKLGPSVVVQAAGVTKTPEALPGNEQGLQRNVKPFLPMIDVAVWRERLFRLEGRVCRVEVDGGARGTGFLVGPEAVITNYHVLTDVIGDRSLASKVKFRFDYKKQAAGVVSDGTLIAVNSADWLIDSTRFTDAESRNEPDAEVPTPDQLDFVLVRLERPLGSEPLGSADGSERRGWIGLPKAAPMIRTDPPMPILILQHPNEQPLKLAVDTEGVFSVSANGTRLRYKTNTEPGSSGSPCFDMDWKLIALHHYGDPLHNHAQFNQGIPAFMIRERLRREKKEGALGEPID